MNVVFTLGRISLVAIFIVSGALKLIDIAGTAGQIQSKLTIPAGLGDIALQIESTIGLSIWQILAIIAGLVELVAALLIAFNVFTRTMAVVLFIYTGVMSFYLHDFWNMAAGSDRMNNIVHALKNVSIMGAFLMLASWPRRPVIITARELELDEPAQGAGGRRDDRPDDPARV
jgi:putative oxidoreductase